MRIIIGIAGEGYGHATRCRAVIEHLKDSKDNEIRILTGGKTEEYLSGYYPIKKITSYRLVYINNELSTVLSGILNASTLPMQIFSLARTLKEFLQFKPDLVINDFELFTNWIALILGVPVMHIDNGRIVNEANIETPKRPYLSYLKVKFWGRVVNPSRTFGIVPFFCSVECKKKNCRIAFPPLREEVKRLKTQEKDFVLVYQTSRSYKRMINELKKTKKNFKVYGFGREGKEKNLEFKEFDEKEFLNDLAECSFVVTNGGFSLISECIYLKKPVLSCPIKKQFEQQINAYYLDKIKCGKKSEEITKEEIEKFCNEIKTYKKKLEKIKWKDNFFEEMDNILDKLKNSNNNRAIGIF